MRHLLNGATGAAGGQMEQLKGGREGIRRTGEKVHRPRGPWSETVQRLLLHLRSNGFLGAPEPLGFDEQGQEVVSFIQGEVSNYPLSAAAASRRALMTAAQLLRRYHDATQGLLEVLTNDEPWMLTPRPPLEVVCHGDFAPYNVVLLENVAVGIIDFDTARPGPRAWDIAYAVYRWAPLSRPGSGDAIGELESQLERAATFVAAYGLELPKRHGFAELVCRALTVAHRLHVHTGTLRKCLVQVQSERWASSAIPRRHRLHPKSRSPY